MIMHWNTLLVCFKRVAPRRGFTMPGGACLTAVLSMQEARAAQQQTNGYRLDKSHSFVVNMFDDFEKYSRVPEEYAIPERKAYEPQVCTGLGNSHALPFIRKYKQAWYHGRAWATCCMLPASAVSSYAGIYARKVCIFSSIHDAVLADICFYSCM